MEVRQSKKMTTWVSIEQIKECNHGKILGLEEFVQMADRLEQGKEESVSKQFTAVLREDNLLRDLVRTGQGRRS